MFLYFVSRGKSIISTFITYIHYLDLRFTETKEYNIISSNMTFTEPIIFQVLYIIVNHIDFY